MSRQELERRGMMNLSFPALYVPIDSVEHLPAGAETAKQALEELSRRGLKWRMVWGGLALLVMSADTASLLQYQSWLYENGCSAEFVE